MSAILDFGMQDHIRQNRKAKFTHQYKQQERNAHQHVIHLHAPQDTSLCPSDSHHNHMTLDGALQGTDETQGVICACSSFFPRYLQGLKD